MKNFFCTEGRRVRFPSSGIGGTAQEGGALLLFLAAVGAAEVWM